MQKINIRKLNEDDSIEELTKLLHRGYRQIAEAGLKFVATNQTSDITKRRMQRALCYIAEHESKLIATIAYYPPDKARGCDWYERPEIAKFGQFCVLPEYQKQGIGGRLIELTESLALNDDAEEISLDTAEPAEQLFVNYLEFKIYN